MFYNMRTKKGKQFLLSVFKYLIKHSLHSFKVLVNLENQIQRK